MIQFRLWCQYHFGLLKGYQPNPFAKSGKELTSRRDCCDRLEAFADLIPEEPFSFMDLGCNTGYFVFCLAERGGFGLGIDVGRNEIMVCQTLAALHRVKNVAFSRLPLSPDNVFSLPTVDMVVFLSLFHHFVRYFGQESALTMLSDIAGKAKRYLVFETGQPDEGSSWAKELSFMGEHPGAWGEDMLRSLGFDRVHRLGKFATSVSKVKRHLLLGERTNSIT